MSLPAVSKHLRVLEKAGCYGGDVMGVVHEMQLDAKPLKQAAQWVEEYRKFWEGSLDRLAAYLEKTKKATEGKERPRAMCLVCTANMSLMASGATSVEDWRSS
jgi:hypothetical protein